MDRDHSLLGRVLFFTFGNEDSLVVDFARNGVDFAHHDLLRELFFLFWCHVNDFLWLDGGFFFVGVHSFANLKIERRSTAGFRPSFIHFIE